MGVRGLQSFIERDCPEAFQVVDIAAIAHEYRVKTGESPIIVVDAASCMNHLYKSKNTDWILGGQFKEFADTVNRFISVFNSAGIKLVLFFDGPPVERKYEVWLRRKYAMIKDNHEAFNSLQVGDLFTATRRILLPPSVWTQYKTIFFSSNLCTCYTSIREADEEIAEYAIQHNAFAILGQDTDYVILAGNHYYLSAEHLNLEMLTTRQYCKERLAQYLHLNVGHLPLFASLCGNDVINVEELRRFHSGISRSTFSKHLFPRVADYVNKHPDNKEVFKHLDQIANEVFQDISKVSKLRVSLQSYQPTCTIGTEDNIPATGDTTWNNILNAAQKRHIKFKADGSIYFVLLGKPLFLTTTLEDDRDKNIPSSGLALQPLRQAMYGVLLKEKPNKDKVIEWVAYSVDSLKEPNVVWPQYPEYHPGLVYLWSDESPEAEEARWRVFLEGFSKKLTREQVLALPPNLITISLVLFYLENELSPKVLKPFELETFIALAVVVNSLTLQETLHYPVKSYFCPRSIQLANFVQRAAYHIDLLSDSCGLRVTKNSPAHYMDGKIYQTLYSHAKKGTRGYDLCGGKVEVTRHYKQLKNFITLREARQKTTVASNS